MSLSPAASLCNALNAALKCLNTMRSIMTQQSVWKSFLTAPVNRETASHAATLNYSNNTTIQIPYGNKLWKKENKIQCEHKRYIILLFIIQ